MIVECALVPSFTKLLSSHSFKRPCSTEYARVLLEKRSLSVNGTLIKDEEKKEREEKKYNNIYC